MNSQLRSKAAFLALVIAVGAAPLVWSAPTYAVDTTDTPAAVDLTSVRAKIKAQDYAAALAELKTIADKSQDADVYNLLGFTSRKTGDFKNSLVYYSKALDIKPDHKAAHEYLGELYIQTGETAKAKEQLEILTGLCPSGCEERDDLKKALEGKSAGNW